MASRFRRRRGCRLSLSLGRGVAADLREGVTPAWLLVRAQTGVWLRRLAAAGYVRARSALPPRTNSGDWNMRSCLCFGPTGSRTKQPLLGGCVGD
jgi:hypothetical protein